MIRTISALRTVLLAATVAALTVFVFVGMPSAGATTATPGAAPSCGVSELSSSAAGASANATAGHRGCSPVFTAIGPTGSFLFAYLGLLVAGLLVVMMLKGLEGAPPLGRQPSSGDSRRLAIAQRIAG
jgi:hypothetical protein